MHNKNFVCFAHTLKDVYCANLKRVNEYVKHLKEINKKNEC